MTTLPPIPESLHSALRAAPAQVVSLVISDEGLPARAVEELQEAGVELRLVGKR